MTKGIAALILAAGESRRMGQPKLLLPWGVNTVLGKVVETFTKAGVEDILVITGGERNAVESEVARLAKSRPVRAIYNPLFASGGMLSSIQTGLASLDSAISADLIGLGDQPQVQEETIRAIVDVFIRKGSQLVIPSFQGRRGHPWLVKQALWPEILAFTWPATARQFLNSHSKQTVYVTADENILKDLDTYEEYQRQRP